MSGYYTLQTTKNDGFLFNLKAGNHETILTSQVYKSRQSALDGIESVRNNSQLDSRFERRLAKDGSPYFLLLATNGQIIGQSEMYSALAAMEKGIKSVVANGPSQVIKTLNDAVAQTQ
jgi:uncharacterized protein YegP (UPF0339 family)